MKVLVVAVGGVRDPLSRAVESYEERARRYWKLEVTEVDAGSRGGSRDPKDVREAEAERILARIPAEVALVALTRKGKGMTSKMLARYLQRLQVRAAPGVAFVIGGAFGLGDDVLRRAGRKLTLSPMTLPHELARLVLAEQLYRAGTIARGEPYHKER